MQRYRLAKLRDFVPMPDRGAGVFFTDSKDGESIDPMNPFYARMIADGDLVPVPTEEPKAVDEPAADEEPAQPPTTNTKPNGAK
jgi:hypothetical protein